MSLHHILLHVNPSVGNQSANYKICLIVLDDIMHCLNMCVSLQSSKKLVWWVMTKSFTFQKIVFIRKKLKLETFNSKPRNFSDPGWKFLSAVVACLPKKCHETPLQHCNKSYISYLAQERTFSTVCFPLLHNCRHKSVVVLCARAAFGGGEVFTTLFVEDYNLEVSSNKTLARSFWWKCAYGNFSVPILWLSWLVASCLDGLTSSTN